MTCCQSPVGIPSGAAAEHVGAQVIERLLHVVIHRSPRPRRIALRQGDHGIHAACCGPNTWTAQAGSGTVKINGQGAHRLGDADTHCGGTGKLIEGSPNVIVGG